MSNKEDIGEFQGIELDFGEAYHDIRRMMGTKGTDMNELMYHTGLLYVNAPEKWADPYEMLMQEIQMRQEILATLQLTSPQ